MANIDPAPSWANIRRLETSDRNMAGPGGILNDPTTSIAARLNLLRDNDTSLGNSVASVNARQDATDNAIANIEGQVLNAPGTLSDLDHGAPISVTGDQFPSVLSLYNSLGPVLALNESIADLAQRDEFLLKKNKETTSTLSRMDAQVNTALVGVDVSESVVTNVAHTELWGSAGVVKSVAAGEQSATGVELKVNAFSFWVENMYDLDDVTLEVFRRTPGGPGGMPPADATLLASVTRKGYELASSNAAQEVSFELTAPVTVIGPDILIWKLSVQSGSLIVGRNDSSPSATQFRRGWYTNGSGAEGLVITPYRLAYRSFLRTVTAAVPPNVRDTLTWWTDYAITTQSAYCNRTTGAIVSSPDFTCTVIAAEPGDSFQVTATVVGSVAALAVFRDAAGAPVGYQGPGAANVYTDYVDEQVTCPAGTVTVAFTTRVNNVPGRTTLALKVKTQGVYPDIAQRVAQLPMGSDVGRQQNFTKASASYGGYTTSWRAPAAGICYILPTMGQSNALAVNILASDPLVGTNLYPTDCLMFSGGLRFVQDVAQSLVPVAETFDPAADLGQTAAMSWAIHIRRDVATLTGVTTLKTISFVSALGSTALADLTRGSVQYNLFLSAVRRAVAACAERGWTAVLPAIDWMQGERDSILTGFTTGRRKRELLQFARFLRSDVQAITGQIDPPIILLSQTSHASSSTWVQPVREADYELDGVDTLRMAGPIYQYSMSDTIHLDNAGQYGRGVQLARATIHEVLGDGQRTIRVVRTRWASSTQLDVTFDAQVFPLVIDTTGSVISTTDIAVNAGFVIDDFSGSPPSITSVNPTGTYNGIIRITFSSAPATQRIRLGYGIQRNTNANGQNGPVVGARGLLRDSMVNTDSQGISQYNWCPAFIIDL